MNIILLLAALLISFIVFTWLIKVVRATLSTAIAIAIIVLIAQLVFGVGPGQLWQILSQGAQWLWQMLTGNR